MVTADSARNTTTAAARLVEVAIERIHPSELNPRHTFDEEALQELAASIAQHGLLEPVVVRTGRLPGMLEIIAGERRFRAALIAGLLTVPVRDLGAIDDATALRLALVENLQRQDLDPIEEAEGYANLNRVCGLTQAEIAGAVNRSQPAIANMMRLLELPEDVRSSIQYGQLTPAHGRALVKYAKWPKLCGAIAELAFKEGLTSKTLEKGITGWGGGIPRHELRCAGVLRELNDLPEGITLDALRAAGLTVFGKDRWDASTPDVEEADAVIRRLEKERAAATMRQVQELRAQAKAEGPAVIALEALAFGTYERIYTRPPGCGPECACFAKAVDHGQVVEICTDPKRFQKLRTADSRAETKARRAAAKETAEELDAFLAVAPALDPRGLAIVVADRLWQYPKSVGKRLITQFAADVLDPALLDTYDGRRGTYPALAQLPAESLVQILVHGALLDDVSRYQQYGTMPAALVWYMEGAGAQLLPATVDELKRRIREAEDRLSDPKIMNMPGLHAQWQVARNQLRARLAEIRGATDQRISSPIATDPRAQAHTELLALLEQYEILSASDNPTDQALLEFAPDLLDRDDLEEARRTAIERCLRVLQEGAA